MVTIEKREFLKALQIVKSTSDKSALNPILTTVHIKSENGGLTLTCSDLTNASRVCVSANIVDNIDVCVNVDKLTQITSVLDDLIKLEVKDSLLLVKSGKTVYKLLIQNSIDFPQVDFTETDNKIVIAKADLLTAINQTSFATLADQHNVLGGICLTINADNYEVASSDGNRLCCCSFDGKIGKEQKCVVTPKILGEFAKNSGETVIIYIGEHNIVLKSDNIVFKSAILNGTFPDYQKLIPTSFKNTVKINKNALLKSLEKVAILMDERTAIIKLNFAENKLTITAKSMEETATDEIDVDFNEDFKIAFNGKFLIEGLKAIKTDDVFIKMNGEFAACLFEADYKYLLMPINARE